jgi:hypothetical protein
MLSRRGRISSQLQSHRGSNQLTIHPSTYVFANHASANINANISSTYHCALTFTHRGTDVSCSFIVAIFLAIIVDAIVFAFSKSKFLYSHFSTLVFTTDSCTNHILPYSNTLYVPNVCCPNYQPN